MATNFPASLDTLTNPTGTDKLDAPDHAGQHANANDAIEALQAKVGVDSSAVTTSLDYRVTRLYKSVQSDYQSGYSYIGVAQFGTSSSTASWRITRISTALPITTGVATSVAWTDRLTATYS